MARKPTYVAIGASGGEGLDDIRELLAALPRALNAIVLVVLHRLPDRPSRLRETLSGSAHMPVRIAAEGETFEPGTIYIGDPADHLTLLGTKAELVADQRKTHRNRTIDLLFDSVARHAGRSAIGIVLSGSLDDGSRGLAAIHDCGGVSMVLTPKRGRPPRGMPENAIDFDGRINVIGSPSFIARAVTKLLADPSARRNDILERQ